MPNLLYIRLTELYVMSVAVYPSDSTNPLIPRIHVWFTVLSAIFTIGHQFVYLKFADADLNGILDVSTPLCHTVYSVLTWAILNAKAGYLKNVATDLRDGLYEYSTFLTEGYRPSVSDRSLRTNLITFTVLYNGLFAVALMSPLMNLLIYGIPPENPNSSLLITGWFPWKLNSIPLYLLAYTIQLMFLMPVLSFAPFTPVFLYYFCWEIDRQRRKLCYVVTNLDAAVAKRYGIVGNRTTDATIFQRKIIIHLEECINHHRRIIR